MTAAIPAWVDGVLTPVDKLEVHRRGLRHPAVSVFVNRDGQTLLQRRALSKYHTPGLWANACCTHPLWGEDPAACAERRLGEELGIAGLGLRHAGRVEYRADVGGELTEHEVVEMFTARAPEDLACAPNPDEAMEVRWMPLPALLRDVEARPALYVPWLRIYLAEHAAMVFGKDVLA